MLAPVFLATLATIEAKCLEAFAATDEDARWPLNLFAREGNEAETDSAVSKCANAPRLGCL
jgi:hypothetical protein